MRILAILVGLLAFVGRAEAQMLEIGARIAAGCAGSDGSMCGGGTSPLLGAHASLWAGEHIEVSAAAAHVNRSPFEIRYDEPEIDISVTDRTRDFISLLFVYHFLKERPLRPMLGFGSGWYSDARHVTCRPSGCESLPHIPGAPELGRSRRWDADAVFVVGLSGVVRERWVVRGGWQSHRFANDENSTQQLFMGLGYRFGPK